ncbi:endolytic transglycosylase MltG [Desulfovibrio litoralis]|uniref:Endolytic murein transglycosylase n=1 Tax=Desulfovibrio litoralis DSM 11393 TaxID=1121455 RepID=A0A1M7SA26_9BACT|nr:endolytic transglycosylase MltG [Desulfovibrio litoralis]SHN55310.1 conserved hypothetical protein, YceG family [Desulfovibrio litoralis DSM 11393]
MNTEEDKKNITKDDFEKEATKANVKNESLTEEQNDLQNQTLNANDTDDTDDTNDAKKNSEAEERPQVKPKKKGAFLRFIFRTFLMILFILLCIGAYVGYDAWRFMSTPAEKEGREVSIFVEPGTTLDQLAKVLLKEKVISDAFRFKLLAQIQKKSGLLKTGEFAVNSAWTPEQVLNHLIYGKPVLHRLVIREGLPYWEVAKIVEEAGFANATDFIAIVQDKQFLNKNYITFPTAEGFLFPSTYLLQKRPQIKKEDAEKLASLMIKTFWEKNLPLLKELVAQKNKEAGLEMTKKIAIETAIFLVNTDYSKGQFSGTNSTTPVIPISPISSVDNNNSLTINNSSILSGNTTQKPTALASGGNNTAKVISPSVLFQDKNKNVVNSTPEKTPEKNAMSVEIQEVINAIGVEKLNDLIILASLVEKETAVAEERPKVAGVYANRIAKKMTLDCDPTIIYGVGPSFQGSITKKQLNDAQNRYNTYQHAGMPPGPICSPGLASIKAALKPELHKYLFFVATGKPDGSHTFSENYDDHKKAVKIYRQTTR